MERTTLGRMHNPVRGFLHGAAAVASAVALVTLAIRTAWDTPRMISMIAFGLSAVALYTTSSLYHSVPWRRRWKQRMQRLDHSMIFLLVAGTYTPIAFNVLSGSLKWATLSLVWGTAAAGIFQKVFFPKVRNWLSITLYMVMGWFAIVPLPRLLDRLSAGAVALLILGGIFYSTGMILLVTKRPRLSPRVFSYHEVFHVLVISGSVAHFLMILLYVAPIART
ncbi:MAG: hemolysin III family protein [Gammaproteobacteria bacterium]|nr:hemolysin III family protein [Gammaproteobacteria bacterium]